MLNMGAPSAELANDDSAQGAAQLPDVASVNEFQAPTTQKALLANSPSVNTVAESDASDLDAMTVTEFDTFVEAPEPSVENTAVDPEKLKKYESAAQHYKQKLAALKHTPGNLTKPKP